MVTMYSVFHWTKEPWNQMSVFDLAMFFRSLHSKVSVRLQNYYSWSFTSSFFFRRSSPNFPFSWNYIRRFFSFQIPYNPTLIGIITFFFDKHNLCRVAPLNNLTIWGTTFYMKCLYSESAALSCFRRLACVMSNFSETANWIGCMLIMAI